jgi:hypothetical protein
VIDVLVPVLGRPGRAAPLVESLGAHTTVPYRCLFLVTAGDDDEAFAAKLAGAEVVEVPFALSGGDYARKINYGVSITTDSWILQAGDDLAFRPGWDEEALAVGEHSVAGVVGTNDLGNPVVKSGRHSTHSLIRRSYVEELGTIDEQGKALHEGYWHCWCNPPEAPIWMADLSFRALAEVQVGDEVMGWERVPAGSTSLNQLRNSRVLGVQERVAPLIRVLMESGREVRCTPDHLWLSGWFSPSAPRHREWIEAKVGSSLLRVIDDPIIEVAPALRQLAGWLGGIYDGEGSGLSAALQSEEANPEVTAAIQEALLRLDIAHTRSLRPARERWGSDLTDFVLTGGRQGYLKFLLLTQPVKRGFLAEKILGGKRFGQRDRIVAVEPAGESEVISLTTETGNYVAWGYASKNCDNELVETAKARRAYFAARRSRVEHHHWVWGKGENDRTYQRGQERYHEDYLLFIERRRLWRG